MPRLLLLALLCLLAPAQAAMARDTLRVAIPLEPPILDPTAGAAAAIDDVTYHTIFEGLVTLAPDGAVRPLLATRWRVSADGMTYVFALRPGVRFHDGERFDAQAVAFSLRRATAPGSTNAQREALSNIAGVEALDPLTVRVTLRARDADFLRLLSYGDAAMVPPRAAAMLATLPIGTGPFRFAGWRRGDRLTLARDDLYWGAAPRLGRIDFRFIADPGAAFAAVRAHDVDLFLNYPAPETLDALRRDPTLAVSAGPSEGQVILAFNQRVPALADARVRRAIQLGLDRRAIIDGAMYGYGTPIGSHFPPQSPDYLDLTGVAPHDPAAARRLLAEAGHARGLALTLKLPPQAYARRAGEIVAAELGEIGIRVSIRAIEWAQWLDEVHARHDFELTIVNHAEPFDYDIYGRRDYYFGYASPAYDALLAALKRTDDPARRHLLLQAAQRRLAADSANGFLFEYPRLGVADAALRDIWINTPNQAVDWSGIGFADGAAGGREPARGGVPARALAALLLAAAVLAGVALGPAALARRGGILLLTLLVASGLVFLLVQVVPGDPAATMMGLEASPRAVAALRSELGLEGPAAARYGHWLLGMARGDFGTSYTYRVPVAGLIADRLAVSVPLALLATALSIAVGLPAGILAARARGRWAEALFGWSARVGIAMPSFWLASLLVLVFAVRLRWVGAGGFPGWSAGFGPALTALALPTLALALPQAAILARVMRAALVEALAEPHIRTARAKGLSADEALRRHALPNALGPVLTVLGLQIPFLLAGGAIIEAIFFLPGLGQLVLQAIGQRDLIVVQSAVMVLVAATVVASFAVDLLHAVLDPRLREGAR